MNIFKQIVNRFKTRYTGSLKPGDVIFSDFHKQYVKIIKIKSNKKWWYKLHLSSKKVEKASTPLFKYEYRKKKE